MLFCFHILSVRFWFTRVMFIIEIVTISFLFVHLCDSYKKISSITSSLSSLRFSNLSSSFVLTWRFLVYSLSYSSHLHFIKTLAAFIWCKYKIKVTIYPIQNIYFQRSILSIPSTIDMYKWIPSENINVFVVFDCIRIEYINSSTMTRSFYND